MAEQEPLIAIVGMAGRFPGAKNVGELWRNLRDGVESLTFWSDEELLEAGVEPELLSDPGYVKACFYLPDVGDFDAGFFEINPREAELTDPQQRIFLEVAWEVLEDAGIDPTRYEGSVGVFASAARTHYMSRHLLTNPEVLERMGIVNVFLSNEKDFLATRVSYKLDLKGPSVTVATACSSSLVGVHLGTQALLNGECDVVLAGGICLAAMQPEGYHHIEGGVFAPDGHVRAFDKRAGGQVGGNGIAMVALKRLEDAIADGDSIRAVIRGSALGNDGIQKVSFSAPGVEGQARVIAEALAVSGVDPETIGYVEAHGTGTHLGDPIEVRALTRAWRQWTDAVGFCPIGSLKTNVGHLDAGAGVAGIIKSVLALQHGMIPPSLNYDEPNPEIDFEASPFFVNTELRPWPRVGPEAPRRAAVSSFGMGGTNAHAILEEAPALEPTSASRGIELLCVSARGDKPLEAATGNLAKHLEAHRDTSLADVAYTTQLGRRAFRRRRVVLATDRVAAANGLRQLDQLHAFTGTATDRPLGVGYLFTGQGAQYPNMMRGLYESEPTFRDELDRCLKGLAGHMADDLGGLLFPEPGGEASAADALARTENTQPALFAVEWALAQLWMEWGVTPEAMLGHSIGEYVAACLAGVFSLEDALRLVAARGRAIGELPPGGAMIAVNLDEAQLTTRLSGELAVAAVNAPELCVVSGPEAAVAALEAELNAGGISARRLHTSHAFHSALMDDCLDGFRSAVRGVKLSAPKIPVVSCTTGTWLSAEEATDSEYWVRHLRQPVRFADGLRTLAQPSPSGQAGGASRERALLEIGPGETLCSLARLSELRLPVVASSRHPKDERADLEVLTMALGKLWVHGVQVDWRGVHRHELRRRVPLPTYPWEHQRYWIDPPAADSLPKARKTRRERDPADWFYTPSWRRAALPLAQRAPLEEGAAWLLLPDATGLAGELQQSLEAAGAGVSTAAEEALTLEALRARFDREGVPGRIVDLRGVDPLANRSAAALQGAETRGFEALMALGQALAERELTGEVRIDVITTGMQDVLGGELGDPEKATVLGVCKAISAELTGVSCRSVDLERAAPGAARHLTAELLDAGVERSVAWRGPHRWVADYAPVRLQAADARAARLVPGGCYLVTGGLGGIGLALAELLAREVRAKLVLTGRSGLPDAGAWDAWLAEHGAGDGTSRRIRAVRALEQHGAEVLVCAADAADEDAMRAAIEAARARFGKLSGVIHSAGLPGAGLLSLKTPEQAAAVLAPKVRGTQVLERLLADEPLDLFVLCSSLATAVTAVGQVDYFAANAYLDAWAHAERARHPQRRTVAINWDAWNEVGMAVDTAVPEAMRAGREEALKLGLSNEEGRDALLRILSSDLAQVLVSTRDLGTRIIEHEEELAIADESVTSEGGGSSSGAYARPTLSTEYRAAETSTEGQVAEVWADLLGLDRVGIDDSFFELGGNSLLMMQLSVRLKGLFGMSLPIKSLFDAPTVRALAERIDSILALPEGDGGSDTDGGVETEEFAL